MMLSQLHTIADIAADHRRDLQAEADAYRLARTAQRGAPAPRSRTARCRGWLQLMGVRRAAGAAQ